MSVNTYNSTTGVLTRVAGNGGGSFIYPHISITAETGSTVTITDGTATITAIETSEGLFEADVIDLKTYTIIATLDGATLTQTLDVDTVKKYSVDMGSNVPEGSTVTPTDDIQIWLACAEITDKNYTTLAEVLADTDTYQLLLSNSNACDYMARSTTWALAEGAVPTMTSNTTPSGEVSGTMVVNNQDWWQAFDGDDTTMSTGDGTISTTILGALQYHFASPVTINKIDTLIYTYAGGSGSQAKPASNFKQKFYASEDGTNWDLLYEDTTSQNLSTKRTLTCDISNKSYSYLKVDLLLDNLCWGIRAYTIQAYTADIATSETAMRLLGKYDYACNKLLSNATWASAIANSSYWEYVLKPLVPTMTSNTTPSGECFGSGAYNSSYYNAFDGVVTMVSGWASQNDANDKYVGYEFTTDARVKRVTLWTPASANNNEVKTFKVQYYNSDTSTWVDASDVLTYMTATQSSAFTKDFVLNANASSTKWRFLVLSNIAENNIIRICEAQFYGVQSNYQEGKVAIHGARNATLYYKDSGSDITIGQTDSTTGIASVTLANIPTGTYAIYDGVAKDPSNLSNDYSKTVTITSNTTEVYLMPDNALYWWGYEDSNLGDISSANGWTIASNYSFFYPTHQTNYIDINGATQKTGGVGTINDISLSKLHFIAKGVTISGSDYGAGQCFNTKNQPSASIQYTAINTNTDKYYTVDNVTSDKKYASVQLSNARRHYLYALWYE